MFVDPRGKVIGKHEGEIVLEPFDNIIAEMVREFDGDGLIDRRPMTFKLESEKEWELRDGKLYVADTNNHAVRVADLETGEVSTLELRGL